MIVIAMSGGVADNAPLDYARIQLIPSEDRYEAFVCCGNEVDALAEGNLDALLLHLPDVQELNSKGSKASIKLQLPASSAGATWFTKSTLSRFLHVVGSPELTNIMKTMNEMAQLEDTKRFHLSLYGQGQMSKTEEKDSCNLDGSSLKHGSGPEFASSAASKNELLRAMDLRLTALNKELTAAFEKAYGATCSSKEISHLAKFSEHFGAINLKNCTYKYLELNPKSDTVELVNDDDNKHTVTSNLSNENAISINGSLKAERSNSSTPVKYGVSPAKVAQIERQDSSETEESSDSDNENGTPAERSRTMVRSALSRRSASPMRRVQIGRTGSRRAPAIMIRSLNHLQTRDGMFSQGDVAANSGDDEEGSEPSCKAADNNVGRISVQAAISLFESKQRNDPSEVQKRSLANITVGANKFVLRRWSTGMGEASTKCQPELVSDESDPISHDLAEEAPTSKITEGVGSDNNISSIDMTCTTAEVEVKLEDSDITASGPPETRADSPVSKPQEVVQKLSANSEWTRRKEAELDQMLKKVMESKLVAQKNSQATRKKDVNSEQRGELYDQYKAKRDEKRRAEEAKVHTNKEAKTKGIRRVADDRRSKIASTEVNVTKKRATRKPEVPSANLSKPEKLKKEISKPSTVEKIPSRTKPMAATRKSWPSSASERTTGISPVSTNATRQKAQPVSSLNRLSAKMERSSPVQKKNVKENNDSARDTRRVNEKKEILQAKTGKITKAKVTPTGDTSVPVKLSIRDKVAKKSSIVPVESKSFHKGSRNSLDNSSPVISKTKSSKLSKSADSSKNSKKLTRDLEVEVTVPDLASQPDKEDVSLAALCDSETVVNGQQDSEMQTVDIVDDAHLGEDLLQKNEEKSSLEIIVEGESMIPPKSTEEIEEFQEITANNDDTPQLASLENAVPIENPRVRLSLSQMLQEENSEPDNIDWGIAENPPTMNYQRGAPKGFKRLLKFARKSKGEANLAGWSSPSVVSEGEDDSEESKSLNTKKADNLLMKATHNSGLVKASLDKNFDHEKLYSGTYGAQNFSSKFQESHDHAAVSSTKVGRSFFSLSAFRGSK
ncbi:uncharacterized protein LOC111447320 isoform X1 [Cucurbita moschata]|uniref:Uncharacterized protein LOC111447320 isoform X1 n=2 Tax=Cucurbita moschata TaxID=3662 RepID=A0A6J1FU63_CUCMO|nr:uncharacterized protein LOC111447320 isoform X1 [Cucurbita moschata]